MKRLFAIIFFVGLLFALPVNAQKYALSTNVVDWAYLGTMNLEGSMAVARHFSLHLGLRDNPWEFHQTDPDMTIHNQMRAVNLGVRYWPWYVNSGWWLALKGQCKQYSYTGIWRPAMEEGTALGGGLSAGYTLMLSRHLNMELGAGVWAGKIKDYVLYCCPVCMDIREQGPRNFVRLEDIYLSFVYVF